MKKIIAAAVLTLAAIAGCSNGGNVDAEFVQSMREDAPNIARTDIGDAEVIRIGHRTCDILDEHTVSEYLLNAAGEAASHPGTEITPEDVAQLLVHSVESYCDEHSDELGAL